MPELDFGSDAKASFSMILAINQPYFLPYIGYFQLIALADEFIVYDNIKYTKKGWINRNRFLRDGEAVTFTLPLKAGADHMDIDQRALASDYSPTRILNQLRSAYGRAPCFDSAMPVIEDVLSFSDRNLFRFVLNSLVRVCRYLDIQTPITVSSTIDIDHGLKSERKVLALCEARGADRYVNAIGGTELYSREDFAMRNIELRFLKALPAPYPQFGDGFVPWLSIVDVMMFNPVADIRTRLLPAYELV